MPVEQGDARSGPDPEDARPAEERAVPTSARFVRSAEFGLVGATFVAIIGFGLAEPSFLTAENAQSILRAVAAVGLIAVGQGFLLITHEFDLSVGAVAGFGAVLAGQLMISDGVPWPLAGAIGVLAGATAGLVNGLLVAKAKIPALVVTLGMLYVARGLSSVTTGGYQLSGLPAEFRSVGVANILGLPWGTWIFLAAVVGGEVVLRFTTFGRRLYATGGNPRAAEYTGLRPERVKIIAFVLVGSLSAMAGILTVARIGMADPTVGGGWELQSIGGAVVGGISLFGGVGTVLGAFLGVVFLQVITTGLIIGGFDTSLKDVAVGVLLITAIAVDRWRQRRFASGA